MLRFLDEIGVRPGSIVVMHANGRGTHTAETLARLVPTLRDAGYRFVEAIVRRTAE